MNDWGGGGGGARQVLSTAASNTLTASLKTFHISLLTHTHSPTQTQIQRNQNNSISFISLPSLRNLRLLSLTAMLSAAFFPAVIRWQSNNLPNHIPYHFAPLPKALGKSRHLYTGRFQLVLKHTKAFNSTKKQTYRVNQSLAIHITF